MGKGSFISMMIQMASELIFTSQRRLRMPANTASEQSDVIGTIEPTPESLESGHTEKKNTEKSNKSNQVIESWHWE